MTTYIEQAFQRLLEIESQLEPDTIAARLFHICGCSRYLQKQPYILMSDICFLIDFKRSRQILEEWRRLMFIEMDSIPKCVDGEEETSNLDFKHIYISNKSERLNCLIPVWIYFAREKDVWFPFRNKCLHSVNRFLSLPAMRWNRSNISPIESCFTKVTFISCYNTDLIYPKARKGKIKIEKEKRLYSSDKIYSSEIKCKPSLQITPTWFSSGSEQGLRRFMRNEGSHNFLPNTEIVAEIDSFHRPVTSQLVWHPPNYIDSRRDNLTLLSRNSIVGSYLLEEPKKKDVPLTEGLLEEILRGEYDSLRE